MIQEQATLHSVKLKGTVTEIVMKVSQENEETGETYDDIETKKSPMPLHEDFTDAIDGLRKFVAETYNLNPFKGFDTSNATKPQKDAFKTLKTFIERENTKTIENIQITGLKSTGTGKKHVIQITAKHNDGKGGQSPMKTPRILVSGKTHGFETNLIALFEAIQDEAYEYMYNSKSAQIEFFEEPTLRTA